MEIYGVHSVSLDIITAKCVIVFNVEHQSIIITEVLKVLDAGANPNQPDNKGTTALASVTAFSIFLVTVPILGLGIIPFGPSI